MSNNQSALVSIGLPVFNGEKRLANAINSLLEQDYCNFEIIISDNGSTDATPEICEEFVNRDKRIRYVRAERNQGVIWNFNHVFELSSGEYFMWAADDDLRDEKFISSCVNELGLNKQAVLCLPHTKVFIEGNKEALYVATLDSFTNKTNLIDRYKETIKSSPVLVIYGVFRSSAINKTKIMQDGIIAADLCFIREISLYGEFIQIPEVLFSYYGRENWNSKEQDYHVFLGDKPKPFFHLPFIGVFTTNCNDVLNSSIPLYIKIRLIIIIFRLELIRLGKRFFVRVLNVVLIKRWKNIIGSYVYNKWFSNINYKIINNKLYHSRVVMTQLGWKER